MQKHRLVNKMSCIWVTAPTHRNIHIARSAEVCAKT